ncbi:CcdB family protein [Maricaulis sp.]|uniref:CcdB family protein n=2 Tax=Maricaulis TaxID=74317 RepID=UPI00260782B1|nr:CcdB family protein [Maricaulis sp.]MDF1768055.1 CcdB family protein [Maricaulis sp.]
MARFDVYRPTGRPASWLVDVQSGLLSDLESRVGIPLLPVESGRQDAIDRLMPVLGIEGRDFVLVTTDIAMVPTRLLGAPITNIEAEHRDTITAAMDFLFQGY